MTQTELSNIIHDAAYEVRNNLYAGYLEKVYRNALIYELRLRGLQATEEVYIPVKYKGVTVGDFRADIVVENSVIIELKAVNDIEDIHIAQLLNYLHATGIDRGIIINYGKNFRFREKTRLYSPTKPKTI